MIKRTYNPNTAKKKKVHGFMSRMSSKAGRDVLARRRSKGRHKIAI